MAISELLSDTFGLGVKDVSSELTEQILNGDFAPLGDVPTPLVEVRPVRSIAGLVAHIVVEEQHEDELTITDHPVDIGAAITDHAYKEPSVVTLSIGFSASGNSVVPTQNPVLGGTTNDYLRKIYSFFLGLQVRREMFEVLTGKRNYSNMLLKSISTSTDASTEHMLGLTVTCREVLIARTQVVKFPAKKNQKLPKKTSSKVDKGRKSPVSSTGYNGTTRG